MAIDMKCPGCGAGGRVPRDKLNTRLVCKKCLKVFHMSPSGQPVLGEPPAQREQPKEKIRKESGGGGIEFGGSFDGLTQGLSKVKLPKVSGATLGIAAAVIVLAGLGFLLFSRQSLEKRSELVARSLSNPENMKVAIDLSVPETVLDTIRWYSEASKKYGELKMAMGGIEAGLTINVLSDGSTPPAVVVAQFSPEGTRLAGAGVDTFQPTPSLANASSKVEIHLYFVKDSFGNWLLDGTRTFNDKP
jgi:hypothetical protein